jgi:hypothetical protein
LIATNLPISECATLREVGHAAYWEAPHQFNALLLNFLQRLHTHNSQPLAAPAKLFIVSTVQCSGNVPTRILANAGHPNDT